MDIDKKLQQYRKDIEPTKEQEDRVYMRVFQEMPSEKPAGIFGPLFSGSPARFVMLAAGITMVFIIPFTLGTFQTDDSDIKNYDETSVPDAIAKSESSVEPSVNEYNDSGISGSIVDDIVSVLKPPAMIADDQVENHELGGDVDTQESTTSARSDFESVDDSSPRLMNFLDSSQIFKLLLSFVFP